MRRKNKTLLLVILGFVFLILAARLHFSSYPKVAAAAKTAPAAVSQSSSAKLTPNTLAATGTTAITQPASVTTPVPLPSTSSGPALGKEGGSAQHLSQEYYSVVKVVDGDTLDILMNGQTVRLRLIGINTPETVDPNKPVECFGPQASANAHKILDGQEVRIAADPSQDDKDIYGRLLRYVWRSDGLFYNLAAIKDGFAYEYTFSAPYQYQTEFKAAQKSAQNNKLGLWSACQENLSKAAVAETASSSAASQCLIKGNINSSGVKIYELPDCPYYKATVIDESKGEKWFCTEAAALSAGWRKAGNCP